MPEQHKNVRSAALTPVFPIQAPSFMIQIVTSTVLFDRLSNDEFVAPGILGDILFLVVPGGGKDSCSLDQAGVVWSIAKRLRRGT
jgi:hypothetical protein